MGLFQTGSLTLTYCSVKPTDYTRTRAPVLINTSPWADKGRHVKKALSKQNKGKYALMGQHKSRAGPGDYFFWFFSYFIPKLHQ